MAGFSVHYLIIDELYDDTVYRMLISYVCNEIRQLVSDANEGEKRKVPKLVGYAENVVPRYLEEDFHTHFRFSNAVYKLIVERLDPHLSREQGGGLEQMSGQHSQHIRPISVLFFFHLHLHHLQVVEFHCTHTK
jgi:hypothetical protein